MINSNELRGPNLILWEGEKITTVEDCFDRFSSMTDYCNNGFVEGIELTDEILEKMGFKDNIVKCNGWTFEKKEKTLWISNGWGYVVVAVSFVHEIQNLIFYNSKFELKFEL